MSSGEPVSEIATDTLGTILGTIAYGFHAALFISFLIIHQSRGTKAYHGYLNIAILLLFTLCTGVVIVKIWQTFYEITQLHETARTNLNDAFSTFYALIDLITQASLTYRCWIIWDRRYTVIFVPMILTLATFGAQLAFVVFPVLADFHFTEFINTGRFAFATSLAVNTIVMTLIISKIWFMSGHIAELLPQGKASGRDRAYTVLMAVLLESGVVIFVGQLCWTVLYSLDNPGLDIIEDLVTQLYGITPLVLMIRVTLGVSYDSETKTTGSLVFASHQNKPTSDVTQGDNQDSSLTPTILYPEPSPSKLEKGEFFANER